MNEKETIKIVTLIVMSYPSSEKFKDETSLKGMVAVWKSIFKDDDARLVEMAVQKHISINKWPPSIAEIREQMINITRPDIIPPDIAWSLVSDVLHTETEFGHFDLCATFPEEIAEVIKTIGWSKLYNLHCGRARGNKDGMDRITFMELYRPVYERKRENAMLPYRIRNICDRKRRELGDESLKMIEQAHKKRIERDKHWKDCGELYDKKWLEKQKTELIGGYEDE